MGSYADVDPVIESWVKATGSSLFTEWADVQARFFHLPGDPPFECFQISVRLPQNGQTAVTARAIDTNDHSDEGMDRTWEGPISELDSMLRAAVGTVKSWKARRRKMPDPPSPQ
ncbi:MAG TPA: hypothetical protein VF589_06605 [Allosphingosinicella sp.]|jgi:hypothetical protein